MYRLPHLSYKYTDVSHYSFKCTGVYLSFTFLSQRPVVHARVVVTFRGRRDIVVLRRASNKSASPVGRSLLLLTCNRQVEVPLLLLPTRRALVKKLLLSGQNIEGQY